MKNLVVALLVLCFVSTLQAEQSINIGGSGADLATFRILGNAFQKHHQQVSINVMPSIGSSGAVRGVISGRVDLGLMSRPLNEKEKTLQLTALNYADTALVFVTNIDNPLQSVDIATLHAVYRGDPAQVTLKPILRPQSDSDTLLLKAGLPQIAPALDAAYQRKGLPVAMTDQEAIKLAQLTDGAIVTSTASVIATENPDLRILALNGIAATDENVIRGAYPLKKSLFLIHDGNLSTTERRFIEFLYSAEGRGILSATGHILVDDQLR